MHRAASPLRPVITVTRRSPVSFDCANIPELAKLLGDLGYWRSRPRSAAEFGRWAAGDALIVLYHSGAVLVQGRKPGTAIRLLEGLEAGR